MPGVIFNAFRDAIYHSMNDRGVYLPDDYNSDAPPAQVNLKVLSKNIFGSMKLNPNVTRGVKEHFWFMKFYPNVTRGVKEHFQFMKFYPNVTRGVKEHF